MKIKVYLTKSPKYNKKFRVTFEDKSFVDFGARGYSDYTIHKNPNRMQSYIKRHGSKASRENWTKTGIKTAGFWSRWLLWSFPTLDNSKKYIENKFQIKIVNH
jgi:hypothetical protein